jgi:hypothetical protein
LSNRCATIVNFAQLQFVSERVQARVVAEMHSRQNLE